MAGLRTFMLFGLSCLLCLAAPNTAPRATLKTHGNFQAGNFDTPIPKDKLAVVANSRKMYGSKKGELASPATLLQATRIYGRLVIDMVGGPLSEYPSAAQFLNWYLQNTGEERIIHDHLYDMWFNRATFSIIARRCLIRNRNAFAEAAEQLVAVNASNAWISTIAEVSSSARLEDKHLHCAPENGKEQRVGNVTDWSYSIGPHRVWMQGPIKRTADWFGDLFWANMTYGVRGFFGSWPKSGEAFGGLVKYSDLARLHTWGLAREYSYSGNLTEYDDETEEDEYGKNYDWFQLFRWPQL
jgi:hypothetical protein